MGSVVLWAGRGGGDISGRSSFDASSGGDYYEDEEGEGQGGYMSDNPMGTGVGFEGGAYMGGRGGRVIGSE